MRFLRAIRRQMPRVLAVFLTVSSVAFSAAAANRGGIQAVVFSRWSERSVLNLVDALKEAKPVSFELSQMPFFNATNPFGNTTTFLNHADPRMELVATFFVTFKDEASPNVMNRAKRISDYLLSPALEGGRRPIDLIDRLVLSPQLEDTYGPDDANKVWKTKATNMLRGLAPEIVQSPKLRLRRSPLPDDFATHGTKLDIGSFVFVNPDVPLAPKRTFEVVRELHGANVPRTGAWSNDGAFVYRPALVTADGLREAADSLKDPNPGDDVSITLATFLERARTHASANLWRPAYNLFTRNYNPCQGQPLPADRIVRWTRRKDMPAAERVDVCTTGFDMRERQVLVEFLLNLR